MFYISLAVFFNLLQTQHKNYKPIQDEVTIAGCPKKKPFSVVTLYL